MRARFGWLAVCALLCLLAAAAVSAVCAWQSSGREFERMAQAMGAAGDGREDLAAAFQSPPGDSALLSQYGYSRGLLFRRGFVQLLPAGLLAMAVVIAVGGAASAQAAKAQARRIEGLTDYLHEINAGSVRVLPLREDEFSRLEDELSKTVSALRISKETAMSERENMARSLADISHQLKTPLTSLSLMTDLLEDETSEQGRKYVEHLRAQVARLEWLVSALLTLSRLDAGTLELHPAKTDAESLVREASQAVAQLFASKGQRLHVQSGNTVVLEADFYWSAQILTNLLKNCSEHTPEGGCVSVRWEQNPIWTALIVEDTGPGISPADLPHLFQRFYRGQGADVNSIGIGLALARSLARGQKGDVEAANRREGGARFTVKFYTHG